jgi:hypothetical protein
MKRDLQNYKTKRANETYLGTEQTATCTVQASDWMPSFLCEVKGPTAFLSPYFIPAPFLSILAEKLSTGTSYFEPAGLGLAQGPLLCGSSSMFENLRREEIPFNFPSLYGYFLVIC